MASLGNRQANQLLQIKLNIESAREAIDAVPPSGTTEIITRKLDNALNWIALLAADAHRTEYLKGSST